MENSYNVLVITDFLFAGLIVDHIEKAGHKVIEIYNSGKDLKRLSKMENRIFDKEGAPDCVVVCVASAVDGFNTCLTIKAGKQLSNVPLILVSTLPDENGHAAAIRNRADDSLNGTVFESSQLNVTIEIHFFTLLLKKVKIFGELGRLRKENIRLNKELDVHKSVQHIIKASSNRHNDIGIDDSEL
jgi:CheY-like chemotaxis protein